MSKRALGKGLDALISSGEPLGSETKATQTVSIDRIDPATEQPRKRFDDEKLKELAESIRNEGIIQPIVVQENGSRYTIVAGERRYRAAKLVGLAEVPIAVSLRTGGKRYLLSLIENLQREDLNPIEEAEAYRTLIERSGASQQEVSAQVGKSRAAIANSLRLLSLPDDVRKSISDGEISAGHARGLLSILDETDRVEVYHRILSEGLSVREVEESGKKFAGHARKGAAAKRSSRGGTRESEATAEMRSIEQQFIESLGTKVRLKGSLAKGSVEISYYSKDDLQRLYDLLIGE